MMDPSSHQTYKHMSELDCLRSSNSSWTDGSTEIEQKGVSELTHKL